MAYTPYTNNYFANYSNMYGLSGLNMNPTYSNYAIPQYKDASYIDTSSYYNYLMNKDTNNVATAGLAKAESQALANAKQQAEQGGGTVVSTETVTKPVENSWSIGDTLGTINAGIGVINAGTSIFNSISNWNYMKQSIKNMQQEYNINQQKFDDYKEDRTRLENMRTNTAKQFSTGSQVKTTY